MRETIVHFRTCLLPFRVPLVGHILGEFRKDRFETDSTRGLSGTPAATAAHAVGHFLQNLNHENNAQ